MARWRRCRPGALVGPLLFAPSLATPRAGVVQSSCLRTPASDQSAASGAGRQHVSGASTLAGLAHGKAVRAISQRPRVPAQEAAIGSGRLPSEGDLSRGHLVVHPCHSNQMHRESSDHSPNKGSHLSIWASFTVFGTDVRAVRRGEVPMELTGKTGLAGCDVAAGQRLCG